MSTKKKAKKEVLKTDLIAQDIANVAEDMGCEPWELTKAQYRKNGGTISEWDLKSHGGFSGIQKAYFEHDEPKDYASIEDLKDVRKKYLKLLKDFGSEERFLAKLKDAISGVPTVHVTPYKPKKNKPIKRFLNLVLSDLHIGGDIDPKETGNSFSKNDEARCLAAVVKNVIEYKLDHRDETELNVMILGDVIENEMHERTSADLIHMQVCRAMYLLNQVIAQFSANFKKVNVWFAVGNHGRDSGINKGRAVALKYNSLETDIYYALRLAGQHLSNVVFHQPKTPWCEINVFGHKFYATHGDTHFNVGNVGSKLDVKSIEVQVDRINASLKDKNEYSVFICGHVHSAVHTALNNGAYLIVNGALTPPNGFANTIGIMENPQIQMMWESTESKAVGDVRMITVNGANKNPELEKIIKPFVDLDTDL